MEFVTANGGDGRRRSRASNIRTLAGQDLDAIAILPYDGAALTPVAQELMDQGIPVVNIDREFGSPTAFRTWIGGDNYGIGRQAGPVPASSSSRTRTRPTSSRSRASPGSA